MSMLDANFKSSASSILVEKILEQGQRLRNSMVQAILNNDPFNQEILQNTNIQPNTNFERKNPKSLKCTCKSRNQNFDLYDGIDKYLRRENLFLNQELDALETNRCSSPIDLLRSASSDDMCHCKHPCGICKEYETKLISQSASASICSNGDSSIVVTTKHQSFHSKDVPKLNTEKTLKFCDENSKLKPGIVKENSLKPAKSSIFTNQKLLKYVDSLKINIYSLKLNNAGHRKIMASTNSNKYQLTTPHTYFIEYSLSEFLTKNLGRNQKRVNSGLDSDKKIRHCTKKVDGGSVYFKQQTIHLVSKVHLLDLNSINIHFNVSFRAIKQRVSLQIGKASFNLGSLIVNRFLSCEQELVVMNENAPVALGTIKISVQLGCDKLYFGKEFIDAISCSKENANLSENDSIHRDSEEPEKRVKSKPQKQIVPVYNIFTQEQHISRVQLKDNHTTTTDNQTAPSLRINDDINLLYAIIFISEVQFTSAPIDSYIICRGFSREDTVTSRTIFNECKPNFNLYQTIPILLDENYVSRLRDNYILIEVWEQKEHDQLLGICKLPLHQFYVAYRNPAIVKYLTRSPHPVISVDWWEPVINPISNTEVGQLRSLVALGTQTQINGLEQTRNIKSCLVKNPKCLEISEKNLTTDNKCLNTPVSSASESLKSLSAIEEVDTPSVEQKSKEIENFDTNNKKKLCTNVKKSEENIINVDSETVLLTKESTSVSSIKVDASTQFEFKMEPNQTNLPSTINNSQRVLLNSFLERLISTRDAPPQNNQPVENNTITEDNITFIKNPNLQDYKTSTSSFVNIDNQQLTLENIPTSNETFPTESIFTSTNSNFNVRHTSDLLDSLQKALTIDNKNEVNKNETENKTETNKTETNKTETNKPEMNKTESNKNNLDTDENELHISDNFKVHILIESALHLPSRKKCKSKKSKTKNPKQNEEILPSTYVTFKGLLDDVIITSVVPKSTSPKWDYRTDMYLPTEFLLNNQKRLIFKVWRKANGPNLQPNFQTDIVLGFAALDLTVLLSGLPNVQGWFNIVDFASKCNGQIKIHVNPLENLSKFSNYKRSFTPEKLKSDATIINRPQLSLKYGTQNDLTEDLVPSDSLSRALKRKFTELDEITHRLRQRLGAVTNDDFEEGNNMFEDEFERDLNTICDDEDFVIEQEPNRITYISDERPSCSNYPQYFEVNNPTVLETPRSHTASVINAINAANEISNHGNLSCPEEGSKTSLEFEDKEINKEKQVNDKLDNHLNEGKLKIDALLEKLTLLTKDVSDSQNKSIFSFTSRYVSGCSNSNPSNTSQTLRDSGIQNQKNVEPDSIFNPLLFQEIFTSNAMQSASIEDPPTIHYSTLANLVNDVSSSSTNSSNVDLESLTLSSTSISRQAPDGAGNTNGSHT